MAHDASAEIARPLAVFTLHGRGAYINGPYHGSLVRSTARNCNFESLANGIAPATGIPSANTVQPQKEYCGTVVESLPKHIHA
ncbi:hypothetical protein E6O75_ATG09346 [Venturia nashicola]|uniref:Uncharacterized protein n=1 Tax=Venturia nashicola TaxID=86259 RepID=A0A4Z1NFP6_9PEZI|nr:hypothetical protein E6O75_ATG09346 [Venturia nashicola]